mmetsp:Transcript_11213/g.31355  ORF Transcript_11213/g.31355 Transcript_11213/m.31355 type:complete len:202 (+) Transcript_11213:279-884(+)
MVDRGRVHDEGHLLGVQALLDFPNLEVYNRPNLALLQSLEDDELVNPVDELWSEVDPNLVGHALLDGSRVGLHGLENRGASDVRGEDDDGVLEVDDAALRVGHPSIVQDLQQDVEDVPVGFFNLVKENDGVWAPAHGFGELAALLVSHVSWGSSDQPADGVLLHVLGHVDADHGGLRVKHVFGQRFSKLCLPDTSGTEEHE